MKTDRQQIENPTGYCVFASLLFSWPRGYNGRYDLARSRRLVVRMHESNSAENGRAEDDAAFLDQYLGGIDREQHAGQGPTEMVALPGPIEVSDGAALPTLTLLGTSSELRQPAADGELTSPATKSRSRELQPMHLATSTLLSLLMVLALLLAARLLVPSLVESVRYGWYRGQLRAEYELSGKQLQNVSLDSLAEVSQLVSQRVSPSVVHINVLRNEQSLSRLEILFGTQHPSLRLEGQGSGFLIDSQGTILTNQHVVEGEGRIEITLSDGRRLPARIVGVDTMTDLAVLKISASGLMPIEWGDSDEVVVGTPVWAAGSPFGLQQTVTFGIISGKHRVDFRATRYEKSVQGGNAYGDMMQSDVALNPGNSGGPLVNSLGQVVGVNAAIMGETFHGISFSIPSKVAQRVATAIVAHGEVARGWLGISMADLADTERFDADGKLVPGVRVQGFPDDMPSPARQAGLEVEDVIIEFRNQPVMNQNELMKLIGETDVGSSAPIAVLRNSQRLEFNIVIGKRDATLRQTTQRNNSP